MNPLSDLVEKMKGLGSDRLVDLLREVHTGGVQLEWDRLPEAAPQARRREAPAPGGQTMSEEPAEPSATAPFDDARRFFVELERKMEKQQSTADVVIDRLRSRDRAAIPPRQAAATAPQQLVSIVALPGTRAGGRFVVVQNADTAVRVELRVGPLRSRSGESIPASITLDPSVFDVAPHSRRVVTVSFDLTDCDVRDGDRLDATIDAVGPRGQALMKVFVEIAMHAEGDHDQR